MACATSAKVNAGCCRSKARIRCGVLIDFSTGVYTGVSTGVFELALLTASWMQPSMKRIKGAQSAADVLRLIAR